jgi:hypothetical protein
MWTAALVFIQPALKFLKPYWKYLVGAAALIGLSWAAHNWYEGELDAAYKRGVAVTEALDAQVLKDREDLNARIVSDLRAEAAARQAELLGKIYATNLIADNYRAQLRARRVCSDERSGRAVPGDPGAPSESNGAIGDARPVEPTYESAYPTIGDDIISIGEACQVTTDKLLTLQGYVRELFVKLSVSKSKK